MSTIKVLDPLLAEMIAAGEVVDRPASIVKELIENSIDAKATQITVEIKGGGIGYIRISDDGHGIPPEDVPTAFLRHATSKISSVEDLHEIATLGFRGEALSAISAVSKVNIITKTPHHLDGTEYSIQGNEVKGPFPLGAPSGTTIIIRDVFHNIPARMKFLRKDTSEGNAIAQVVDKAALSHPEIAFTFLRDSSVKLKTSGNGDLRSVAAQVYDRDFATSLLTVSYSLEDGTKVTGLIGLPEEGKPSRTYQNFFVNKRHIRSGTCSAALEQAYKGKIMSGRFPSCVLNIELPAHFLDPNVHPAKTEVRFTNDKNVFNAVYYAVKTSLNKLGSPLLDSIRKKHASLAFEDKMEPFTQQTLSTTLASQTEPPLRTSDEIPAVFLLMVKNARKNCYSLQNVLNFRKK